MCHRTVLFSIHGGLILLLCLDSEGLAQGTAENEWGFRPVLERAVTRAQISANLQWEPSHPVLYVARGTRRQVAWQREDKMTSERTAIHARLIRYVYHPRSSRWRPNECGFLGISRAMDFAFELPSSPIVEGSGFWILEDNDYGCLVIFTIDPGSTWGIFPSMGNTFVALAHNKGSLHSPKYGKIHERGPYSARELQKRGSISVVWAESAEEDTWMVLSDSGHILRVSRPTEEDWGERGPNAAMEDEAFGRIKLVGDLAPGSLRDESGSGDVGGRQFWCVGAGEMVDSSATVLCLQEKEEESREVAILDVAFGDEIVSDVVLTEGVDESLERFHVIVEQEPDPSVLEWFCMEPAESGNVLHLGKYVKEAGISWTQVSFPADSDPLTGYRDKDGRLHMFALTGRGELVELTLEEER
jgi:hypothetical protein